MTLFSPNSHPLTIPSAGSDTPVISCPFPSFKEAVGSPPFFRSLAGLLLSLRARFRFPFRPRPIRTKENPSLSCINDARSWITKMARKTIFILGSFVRPFVDVVLSTFFVFHSMSNCNSEVSQMKERSVLLVCCEYGRLKSGFSCLQPKKLIIHDSGRTTTDAIEKRQDVRGKTSPDFIRSRMKVFPPFC